MIENTVNEFLSAMEKAGLGGADRIEPDGKLHRFTVDGDRKGSEAGWYILHIDERPAGKFGSWKTGQTETWVSKPTRKLTEPERKALERRISEQKKLRDEEEIRVQADAARRAAEIWRASVPADPSHAYALRKKITPLNARQAAHPVDGRMRLVVPMRDSAGNLTSLQFIDVDGTKRFLLGGKITGSYAVIAKAVPDPRGVILIAEGYATACSLFQATGYGAVVAFNAGNLTPVARAITAKYPEARIVICADDDRFTEKNPGLTSARAAAEAIGAFVAHPFFSTDSRGTDFNDLAVEESEDRVHTIIDGAIYPGPPPTDQGEPIDASFEIIPSNEPLPDYPTAPHLIQFPHLTQKGKPKSTIENVEVLIRESKIEVFYDVIRKDLDIRIPGRNFLVDTAKSDKMTHIVSLAGEAGVPISNVPEFVSYLGGARPANPVIDWIGSKPWDGVSRMADFYATVTATDEATIPRVKELKELVMYRWMLSAVAAAYEPKGVVARGVLVFQGAQNLGKTHWFKNLVPKERELVADGIILDPRDKDSVYQTVTHWLVELGEVDATFRKSDIAQLKAFLTKDRDTLRRPYARGESSFARRTVFFASVNPEHYLSDTTGSTRFWTVACEKINHRHGLDMQQVWAEFHAEYKGGASWHLSPDEIELLNSHNQEFEGHSPVEELIRTRYDWDQLKWCGPRMLTATDIALEVGIKNPTRLDLAAVGKAIRDITGQASSKSGSRRIYSVPSLKTD